MSLVPLALWIVSGSAIALGSCFARSGHRESSLRSWTMCIRGAGIEGSVSSRCIGLRRGAACVECLRAEAVAEDVVHTEQLIWSRTSSCWRSASSLVCLLLLCVDLSSSMCDYICCCSYLVAKTMLYAANWAQLASVAAAFVNYSVLRRCFWRPEWRRGQGFASAPPKVEVPLCRFAVSEVPLPLANSRLLATRRRSQLLTPRHPVNNKGRSAQEYREPSCKYYSRLRPAARL